MLQTYVRTKHYLIPQLVSAVNALYGIMLILGLENRIVRTYRAND